MTNLNEKEKVNILLSQLKIANDKWRYLEDRRLRTLELFLSSSGISSAFLFFSKTEDLFNVTNANLGKYLLPLLFVFIGLIYYALFWYREYYYQLTKSWLKRIEQELKAYYQGEKFTGQEEYDGAYRLYYYETNFNSKGKKFSDWSSYIHSLGISFTTLIVSFFAFTRFESNFSFSGYHLALIIAIIVLFNLTREIILRFLCHQYEENQDKRPPDIYI
jgi:hypothetical protein